MNKIVNNPSFTDNGTAPDGQQPDLNDETGLDEKVEQPEGEQKPSAEGDSTVPETIIDEPAEDEKVVIGDNEFTKKEIAEIIEKGQKVRGWETKMPGFDIDKLMPDYTKKSQRLAAYEKRSVQVKEGVTKEKLKELGIEDDQVSLFRD